MGFFKNDLQDKSGNREYYGAINIMRMFGQITVKQVADIFEITEADARATMHRAWHNRTVEEVSTDKYILNCSNVQSYNLKMEYAMTLAILMCKENENLDFNDFMADEEEPFLIWMPMGEDEYDILYIEAGKEKQISNRLRRMHTETNYLVILEHIGQLENLAIDNVSAIYLAKEEGELEYVQ